ncbi:ArsO family NAD(P)H-dependent flavin-containing monooxygenase [Nocardiopsis metallicus]|uniref:Cation diffusion facilitator CzcD-associated flavoprotein CzcO n=1 Tax=Nocardiopsis metallicus TaxID=179819 RepID=A0A840W895_9ACTN|nr:ArsO family NAD(P)H-dependent flavin-containing monooxygenase [Nocardiopsis metallicus]MBB5493239.1 cation diffusion facilitator CzcD-associated flavoprotein CzcO [Nocardiopsis metallicus]
MGSSPKRVDVAVVGGGQAGLAAGYFLRRARRRLEFDFAILDDGAAPGGAWSEYWDSLLLFSPAGHSMLPGWWMPEETGQEYPSARHAARYLSEYERRYDLPVHRPVHVHSVEREADDLLLHSGQGDWRARYAISATGTWRAPYVPDLPGRGVFEGRQAHTADYRGPQEFAGQRVVVVGGGNSAAQILAELSSVARTRWVTLRPPRFLPDDVDGRALFSIATRRQEAAERGEDAEGISDLGDIVAVPSVRRARDRGALRAEPVFDRLTPTGVAWADGTVWECDAVLWCTGFRPALNHLEPLGLVGPDGRVKVEGTRSVDEPRLHLLGYGDWTGAASATIIGAGRTAKGAVAEVVRGLEQAK